MDATIKGVPADILHTYVGPTATMQVRVASLVTIVDAHGPEMDPEPTSWHHARRSTLYGLRSSDF